MKNWKKKTYFASAGLDGLGLEVSLIFEEGWGLGALLLAGAGLWNTNWAGLKMDELDWMGWIGWMGFFSGSTGWLSCSTNCWWNCCNLTNQSNIS